MAELMPALREYFGHEGLYSDDPGDPGGETWMGIARKRQRGWRGWAIIDDIAQGIERGRDEFVHSLTADLDLGDAVHDFYLHQWESLGLGQVPDQSVAVEVFEAGQNVGPRRALKWLQEVLNAMNREGKDWPDIAEDGGFGARTLFAVRACLRRRGTRQLVLALNGRQYVHYWQLVRRNPDKWERFFNGFLRRVSLR